jgi:hypothetical protein
MAPQELYYDIGNLTDDDTDQLASLASWRARLFGNTKRLRKQVPRLLSLPGVWGFVAALPGRVPAVALW